MPARSTSPHQRACLPKTTKKSATIPEPIWTQENGVRPVLAWRFNPAKVCIVIRDQADVATALIKASGVANMCLTGHETQVLIPVADLHRYQKLLGLSAADLHRLQHARWDSPTNPVITSHPHHQPRVSA